MKTFDRKDVFTIATIEDARKYINHEGYFCDSYYLDLNRWDKGILKQVDEDTTDYPFYLKQRNNCSNASVGFRFFLPVDKVRKEKKWRAFRSFKEFSETLNKNVGSQITYRNRDYPLRIITTTIMGFIEEANREDQIQIGGGALKFSTWFNEIEIWNEDKESWQPFGVEK